MNRVILALALVSIFSFLFPKIVFAGRGCCSWHGGQSYCDSSVGRWVCADGTYSPSCGCYKNTFTPKPVIKSIRTTSPATLTPTTIVTTTPTPTATPTTINTPIAQVEGAKTEGGSFGGLSAIAIFLGGSYLALKWLAKVTRPKEVPPIG